MSCAAKREELLIHFSCRTLFLTLLLFLGCFASLFSTAFFLCFFRDGSDSESVASSLQLGSS